MERSRFASHLDVRASLRPSAPSVLALAVPLAVAAIAWLAGCSPAWYQETADVEATAIIRRERRQLFGNEAEFEVAQKPLVVEEVGRAGTAEDLKRAPAPQPIEQAILPESPDAGSQAGAVPEGQEGRDAEAKAAAAEGEGDGGRDGGRDGGEDGGEDGGTVALSGAEPSSSSVPEIQGLLAPTYPAQVFSLDDALRLAMANNRDYQSDRESTYLTALALTLARHRFAPSFFGGVGGDYANGPDGETGSLASTLGFDVLLASGARLSVGVVNNLFQYFTGDRREVANTLLRGTLTQPLLRGFGTEIVREPLTQAERNVVYQIRSLERARKTLAVRVLSEYYRVLQTRDRVTNAYSNWQSLVTNRARVQALAGAERLPQFQVDQALQQEFSAENDWVDAVSTYESALDAFKLTLGIPTDAPVTLDQGELGRLAEEPVRSVAISPETAISVALAQRLDLQTVRDRVEDSERDVRISRNALLAQLDIVASADIRSGEQGSTAQTPFVFDADNLRYGVGFDLDLPLDRKAERNAYVSALIGLDRSRRDLSRQDDSVRLAVRASYRRLEREIASYKIQKESLTLAEQRVDSTTALLQAGRAATRDVLESQSSLNNARNGLTAALINYAIARQEFLLDLEALRVDEVGGMTVASLGTGSDDVGN